jgi:hypothetical protein
MSEKLIFLSHLNVVLLTFGVVARAKARILVIYLAGENKYTRQKRFAPLGDYFVCEQGKKWRKRARRQKTEKERDLWHNVNVKRAIK